MFQKIKQSKPVSLDTDTYKGVDDVDRQSILESIGRQETLIIDQYGHVYNQFGRWIAEAMRKS